MVELQRRGQADPRCNRYGSGDYGSLTSIAVTTDRCAWACRMALKENERSPAKTAGLSSTAGAVIAVISCAPQTAQATPPPESCSTPP